MKRNDKFKDYLVGGILLALVIVGIIIFFIQASKPQANNNENINSYPIVKSSNQIKVEDPKEFTAGDIKITLPEGYTLNQIYSQPQTYYKCGLSSDVDCLVYVIYKEDTAEYFYFSTNAEYIYQSTYPSEQLEKTIKTSLGNKIAILQNAEISGSDDGFEGQSAILTIQSYVALTPKVYASTGYILYDTEHNQEKVQNFLNFLENLTIQNI